MNHGETGLPNYNLLRRETKCTGVWPSGGLPPRRRAPFVGEKFCRQETATQLDILLREVTGFAQISAGPAST